MDEPILLAKKRVLNCVNQLLVKKKEFSIAVSEPPAPCDLEAYCILL
jgi:hypothetical protein